MRFKLESSENYIFVGLLWLLFIVGAYGLVKTPAKTSVSENRTLTQFQHFTLNSFLDGSFQSNFENALSDQFFRSEKIRAAYGEIVSDLPTYGVDRLVCENRYILLDSRSYTNTIFNCDDFIVPPPMTEDPRQKNLLSSNVFDDNIAKYNHINSLVDTYYYFVEEPQSFDFTTGERVLDIEKALQENLQGPYNMSSLQFDSYDEMKKYYYKTDHHWNQLGQYQGYKDIVELLGVGAPDTPAESVTNHEVYYGSQARDSRYLKIKEEFVYYRFNLPEHDTFVDRKPQEYGHQDDYTKHSYQSSKLFNHYGYVFGGDYAEVVFDYHQLDKNNLLVISNSFDNPIVSIIAQHFNKTYAVDLRHYENNLNEKFVLSEYIKKNEINKVLLLIQPEFVFNEKSNQGLEL